jgi:hypothetical protein
MALAREALAAAPAGDAVTRTAAQMALAGAHRELGESRRGDRRLRARPAALPRRGLAVPEGLARAHLGMLYVQRGQLRKATSVTQPLAEAAGHPGRRGGALVALLGAPRAGRAGGRASGATGGDPRWPSAPGTRR